VATKRIHRALFAGMAGEIVATDGGAFPQRRHVNALGMPFMVEHYDHLARWAAWALAEVDTWDDTTTPADTWGDAADAVFRAAARPLPEQP
jgi:hypothetical protein